MSVALQYWDQSSFQAKMSSPDLNAPSQFMAILDPRGSGNYALRETSGSYLSAEFGNSGSDWNSRLDGYAYMDRTPTFQPFGPPQGIGPMFEDGYESFVFDLSANETVGTKFGYQMDPVWVNGGSSNGTQAAGAVWVAATPPVSGALKIDRDIDAKNAFWGTSDDGVVLFFPAPVPTVAPA